MDGKHHWKKKHPYIQSGTIFGISVQSISFRAHKMRKFNYQSANLITVYFAFKAFYEFSHSIRRYFLDGPDRLSYIYTLYNIPIACVWWALHLDFNQFVKRDKADERGLFSVHQLKSILLNKPEILMTINTSFHFICIYIHHSPLQNIWC